jgi:hypothetical protein
MKKEDEDLMQLGSSNDDESSNDEDEKYNQEAFLKRK